MPDRFGALIAVHFQRFLTLDACQPSHSPCVKCSVLLEQSPRYKSRSFRRTALKHQILTSADINSSTKKIMKAIFRGSVPVFAWRESEKPFWKTSLGTSNRDLLDLPVTDSLVYCESNTLPCGHRSRDETKCWESERRGVLDGSVASMTRSESGMIPMLQEISSYNPHTPPEKSLFCSKS
uniref:(California timema) hypothetical protein n=1 Tax=Timema californicum TaxID=61474 RepID=A0A7R9JG24_TIMCA|nr:unnamed protein product [Timema californicum]